MFYPKCPRCGGKAESAESNPAWTQARIPPGALRNASPAAKIAGYGLGAAKGVREIWKHAPGGGDKRCTVCGHHFS